MSDQHAHHHHDDSLADLLDLDAVVMRPVLTDILSWVHERAGGRSGRILDVGAGTGTGTIALAERFPEATVVAADLSGERLESVRNRAEHAGVADRVTMAQVDLAGSWDALGSFDLAWAAASLHEFADPDGAFAALFGAVNRGGVVAVVEIDAPPRFLDPAVGDGVEARVHDVLREVGSNQNDHPDWTGNLTRAGFTEIEKRSFPIDSSIEAQGVGGRYAQTYLTRIRPFVAPRLSTDDAALLDALVADDGAQSVLRRDDLRLRGGRTAWTARRP